MRHSEFLGVEQSIFYILLLELPLVGSKWLPVLLFLNRQVLEVQIIRFSFTLRSPATHVLPWRRQDCTCLPSPRPEVALVCLAPCQKIPWATLKSFLPGGSSEQKLSSGRFSWFFLLSSFLPKNKDTKVLAQQQLLKDDNQLGLV